MWFIPLLLLQSAIVIAAPQEGFEFFKEQGLSNSVNESPIEEPVLPQGMKEDIKFVHDQGLLNPGNESPNEDQKVGKSLPFINLALV